jgi:hypothetical protein
MCDRRRNMHLTFSLFTIGYILGKVIQYSYISYLFKINSLSTSYDY